MNLDLAAIATQVLGQTEMVDPTEGAGGLGEGEGGEGLGQRDVARDMTDTAIVLDIDPRPPINMAT